ncbi:MAG: UTP--glucose-1-phosphate uridylyltransferase GalU [Gammaproteobacteria bacterium]|nr:UTP--glucose-1-phosphate uridylyltransferase GalU [Gammaproteobacteria bacterium]MBT8134739.1 UTP--glucose-1-phosphate uridylyltransferase GalU [Gammaproteobacteria bacterium]NNJ49669.1 UTP--glucose-1-phosphate uridylyltransferase GalU [Gammaproteobacteria bacterium]
MSSIRTAVFPVAGLGTRFLPATKAIAKEMLTVVDKPLIQYASEEAVAAGMENLVFVVGRTKNAIIDHYDKAYELETELALRKKDALLEVVQQVVPSHIHCVFIRQSEALGLGHAVLCAEPAIGNKPFAVLLPDDLIYNKDGPSCIQQMVDVYEKKQGSVIGTQTVPIAESHKYGMVAGPKLEDRLARVDDLIEKPSAEESPSDQAVVGRYILTPAILDVLRTTQRGAGNEIQLTDAIAELRKKEEIYAYSFEGRRYDCGSKNGYLEANVEIALQHDEMAEEFKEYLRNLKLD